MTDLPPLPLQPVGEDPRHIEVTLGTGDRGTGRRTPVKNVRHLADLVRGQGGIHEWFAPGIFEGRRRNEDWRGAATITVDVDYADETGAHTARPSAFEADVPCSLLYSTTRGVRFIFVLDRVLTRPEVFVEVAEGAHGLVLQALRDAELEAKLVPGHIAPVSGYAVDAASTRLAQFMWQANTSALRADGTWDSKSSEVEVVLDDLWNPQALLDFRHVWTAWRKSVDAHRLAQKDQGKSKASTKIWGDNPIRELSRTLDWDSLEARALALWGLRPETKPERMCLTCGDAKCENPHPSDPHQRHCFNTDHLLQGGAGREVEKQPGQFTSDKADLLAWIETRERAGVKAKKGAVPLDVVTPMQLAEELGFAVLGLSEDALALVLGKEHQDELRHNIETENWHLWNGAAWAEAKQAEVMALVKLVCRKAARSVDDPNLKVALRSSKTISAVEKLARSVPEIMVRNEIWDADDWALNTPGGIVDLKKGKLGPSDANAYCSLCAAVTPDLEGRPHRFEQFLDEVTEGDRALQGYLQKWAGYACTGSIREHTFAFFYGYGGNGKSVLLNTLARALGTYAQTAPMDTFMAAFGNRHPTELARMRGRRLIVASETEQGRQWAESKIKSLTGGDVIAAREMHRNFFEFRPQFKLLISGNHEPGLENVDQAMRRRLHVVPFTFEVPEEKKDKDLEDKLEKELPQILGWMIRGCLDWQREGLVKPKKVAQTTDEYFGEQDQFAVWIEDRCELKSSYEDQAGRLFESWVEWCARNGEQPGSQKKFGEKLKKLGLKKFRTRKIRGWQGIRLQQTSTVTTRNHVKGDGW